MNVLMGIGNVDRGDDGVGPYLARSLQAPGWACLDCGTAPENFTGVVRRQAPACVVLVDAAEMGTPPGTVRRIAREQVEDVGIGTHMLPLSHLMNFLAADGPEPILVGIEPVSRAVGEGLSPVVRDAAHALMDTLRRDGVGAVARL